MRILLIDDNANKGWKQIIEKVFPVTDMIVQVALNLQEAENKIEDKFDLIFLDVRLSEQDHNVTNPTEYSGYKILEKIKNNFLNMNFATPIILITATNKIWNVDAFRNYGIDGYYIKEHPNYVFDKETSKQNYNNLKTKFIELKAIGQKRNDIWKLSKDIIDKISKHSYFKENKKYENVKDRIIDKLKLGYDYLFKEPNELEKKVLKTNNEAIAFIIYWSILEEIVKGYSEYKNWKSPDYTFSGNWKFRNTEYFIERDNDTIEVNISKDIRGNWVSQGVQENANIIDFKYINGKINLSEQVYSLLAAYQRDNQQFQSLSNGFNSINSFRNKIDFIHSKIKNIYERPLINEKDSTEQYDFCIKQLTFVKNILSLLP
ncbi:MAG: response regulator [Bacteroidetes bacterium]|jgi:CheY-like chemotaxis protein|nr:response regulator [Bacteroidota bacterium]